ncbi:hypothetical protein G6M89_03135 [Natronolimnobius sp. AArcel1]|uniref:hypothetical protein n=1 Tax=Natronolimnobius sp. AArcel1 TaxID=1679093 RepID=UPI0013ED882E|nr:hypothetical protein [Natronolimnobius sp. AArcel1]NGM68017.1 hypothetical protein [Natronolimnobius sp. AArcel1]
MKANITGENGERVGLYTYDNNNVEHWVEMEFNGDIKYHEQDGYPDDPSKRTNEGNEHVEQARRFARYYVYKERGYETLSWDEHPDRLNTVRVALEDLSLEEFERLFGDFYQQVTSYFDAGTERVVEIPENAEEPSEILYRKDIHLAVDSDQSTGLEQAMSMADTYDIDLEQPPAEDSGNWEAFTDAVAAHPEIDFGDSLEIGAVSDLGMFYLDDEWTEHVVDGDAAVARDPDARIELLPVEFDSLERCQEFLVHHLKCQIRDCFIGMGVEPPAEFRVLGPGRLYYTKRYGKLEMYDEYHTLEADVPTA